VDPVGVLKQLSSDGVRAYTGDLLNRTATFDNFVLSTGCDLPPHVPAENIRAFFEALKEFNEARVLQEAEAEYK
jgi:uroporphyrinogen decarboxylase